MFIVTNTEQLKHILLFFWFLLNLLNIYIAFIVRQISYFPSSTQYFFFDWSYCFCFQCNISAPKQNRDNFSTNPTIHHNGISVSLSNVAWIILIHLHTDFVYIDEMWTKKIDITSIYSLSRVQRNVIKYQNENGLNISHITHTYKQMH